MFHFPFYHLREFHDAFTDSGDGRSFTLEPLRDMFYDPRVGRGRLSEQERRVHDTMLLREIFPKFFLLTTNAFMPTEHSITQGFRNMINGKEIYLWVVFA